MENKKILKKIEFLIKTKIFKNMKNLENKKNMKNFKNTKNMNILYEHLR